ncbi:hypothetical protein [Acinetobacter dispersus]|uniref:hypothetical protein n=1 Tax=Acinetobacter dispersus TaxID=70348 RepID=UPI001F4B9E8D|nr:hypothetical protein [Acinetobacter dispersus]MCH7389598.1 hypothetical protein [Acinetobacter dispersus]MCU4336092.1 hypothetical protein [Acinetobacter dispersus]
MNIKKQLTKALMISVSLLALQSANAAYSPWQYINESVQGVQKSCYFKREILNSNGTGSGQFQNYTTHVSSMTSCFHSFSTNQLPK